LKKLIRNVSAVLAGVLVFFGASVIAANLPPRAIASSESAQLNILAPTKRIVRSSEADTLGLSRSTLPVLHQSDSANPSKPITLAEVPPIALQNIYQHIEEGTYESADAAIMLTQRAPVQKYSERDKILIARVVYSEARGELFEGQVAVATVVINRFESGLFGSSIAKVVFASGQFAITEKYNSKMLLAVEAAIERMGDYPDNMFFFQASKSRTWRNFVYYKRIGNHSFYCAAK
jgi:spore germination cell wall hydrolase CwlJ-like protein